MAFAKTYLDTLSAVVRDIDHEALEAVIALFLEARQRDANIFVVGNGGSAATASHMANDINKLTIIPGERRFKAIAFTDNVPLLTAWGNDSSFDDVFVEQLRHFLKAKDVFVGITTSGNSPNVVKAMAYAKQQGAMTVLFGGETGGACLELADCAILTPTDHQGMQEDCHLIFNHVIANSIREMLQVRAVKLPEAAYTNGNGSNGTSHIA